MRFRENDVYHIYNRGNNRQPIFFSEENYRLFLYKIKQEIAPVADILGWCIMPNHFHLLVRANEQSCMERPSFGGKPMQQLAARTGKLLSSYSQEINKQNGTLGALFQPKTKAKSVADAMSEARFSGTYQEYLVQLIHYIHQNPLKAELVTRFEDWAYSSFKSYAGIGHDGCACRNCSTRLQIITRRHSLKKATGFGKTDSFRPV